KASLAGLAAYLASPLDLIPDWIPGAGYLDDVLIAGFVVSYVLAQVPPDVVREHWGEDVEVLERFRRKKKS
ncbi:MAG TPA: YkvA family protein, partial [Armatimonadota bacterium]|nr:YkvA family protein [Armatimonadota bacterium]